MSVKCKGIEFKAWLNSPWSTNPSDDPYWDDVWVIIDGEGTDDPIPEDIYDDSDVEIEHGVIYMHQNGPAVGYSAENHFKRWKKNLDSMTLVIQFDKSKLDAVKAALAQIKGVKTV